MTAWCRGATLVGIGAIALVAMAHVGSPNVYFSGRAGLYAVIVVVRPPAVVPGRADVIVQVTGTDVRQVAVRPVFWETGTGGAPAADHAVPVPHEPGTYETRPWLMTGGSYSMEVHVTGARGDGTVNVPVLSAATKVLPMQRSLGAVLLGLAVFLLVGALSIVGAASREATLDPGAQPDRARRWRSRIAVAGASVLLALALTGGKAWWKSEAQDYRAGLYKPLHMNAIAGSGAAGRTLSIVITDSAWLNRKAFTPLVRDHGKLMHLFLVRAPAMDVFAHLHPVTSDSNTFRVALPPLPAGSYRVYADIVHASGFPETLTDTVAIDGDAAPPSSLAADSDDAWHEGSASGVTAALDDGSTMTWDAGSAPIVAGRMAPLRFVVRAPGGQPAVLQPYMGMAAHAMIARNDGGVFVHLHPMGSIAMAAKAIFDRRARGDTAPGASAAAMPMYFMAFPDTISFPYAFPAPGQYRVWVQVRRGGRVLTGIFDAEVR